MRFVKRFVKRYVRTERGAAPSLQSAASSVASSHKVCLALRPAAVEQVKDDSPRAHGPRRTGDAAPILSEMADA